MQKIVTVTVPIPRSGMTTSSRDMREDVCRVVTNFDLTLDPKRAIPYRSSESGNNSAFADEKQNFCLALRTGTTYSLYSLCHQSGSALVNVDFKNLTTGGSNDLGDAAWGQTSNNFSSSGSANYNLFVYYPKKGKIYGGKGGNAFWAYYPSGGTAFEEDTVSTETGAATSSPSFTTLAQGLVHSQDDVLYIPYDNKIAANNNGSWTVAAFTGPSGYYITSITEHGADLAIAFAPNSNIGNSRVLVWNRDTSVTTASANIEWQGVVKILESVDGLLIGISLEGATIPQTTDIVHFRYYDGYGTRPLQGLEKMVGGSITTQLPLPKQKRNNRLYFMMSILLNGSTREGVWSVGLDGAAYTLVHERTPNNDTATTSGSMKGFFYVGDYLFLAYIDNGVYAVSKTDDVANYTATSIIETTINPCMPPADRMAKKKLMTVGALYDPLPTAAQMVVKARMNSQAAFAVTIFTETTDNAVKTEPVPVPSAGTYLNDGEELEFRLESTGGGQPTALVYKYMIEASNL